MKVPKTPHEWGHLIRDIGRARLANDRQRVDKLKDILINSVLEHLERLK